MTKRKLIVVPALLLGLFVFNSCGKIGEGMAECYHPDWVCDCACYEVYAPVCGCNNVTYGNDCFAQIEGFEVAYEGECK